MSGSVRRPRVSIGLPVYNGADTLVPVVRSVLAQTWADLELVISDNASTDGTEEISRSLAAEDERIVYQRHPTNVGILNNFTSVATTASGRYLRWIGDNDSLEPTYVERCLDVFADDERRVVVTTQIVYVDRAGVRTTETEYEPTALDSPDPVMRFGEMLRLLTPVVSRNRNDADFAKLDPLYGVFRRELAMVPRRNMLREDQVFATRLALAGPWGHVPSPLASRRRDESTPSGIAHLLGVPVWRSRVRIILQCHEMARWVARSSLTPSQQRRAYAEILKFYARGKQLQAVRGLARAGRIARPTGATVESL